MPFSKPLGSIFLPKLLPKAHQNLSKMDAKMPSHVEFIFWSCFKRFLHPISTPRTLKIKPALQRELNFRYSEISYNQLIINKNPAKSTNNFSDGRLGRSWEPFWDDLRASWGMFGHAKASWAVLGGIRRQTDDLDRGPGRSEKGSGSENVRMPPGGPYEFIYIDI